MAVSASLVRDVQQRADSRCEYCQMHQSLQGATFHIEHIIPRSRKGLDHLDNLALACPSCNLHKSDRIEFIDPITRIVSPLFNPVIDDWDEHFSFAGFRVAWKTQIGSSTIELLKLNHPRRIKIRKAESIFGLFPP